jgi:hypothetical protein
VAAGLLDRRRGRVDGARQLGVRFGGLGEQRDVGAVAGGAHRDRLADAAAAAGHDDGGTGQTHEFSSRPVGGIVLPWTETVKRDCN